MFGEIKEPSSQEDVYIASDILVTFIVKIIMTSICIRQGRHQGFCACLVEQIQFRYINEQLMSIPIKSTTANTISEELAIAFSGLRSIMKYITCPFV